FRLSQSQRRQKQDQTHWLQNSPTRSYNWHLDSPWSRNTKLKALLSETSAMWAAGSQSMAATILATRPKSIVLLAGSLLARAKPASSSTTRIANQESEL